MAHIAENGRAYSSKWYAENREAVSAYYKARRSDPSDTLRKYQKEYHAKNPVSAEQSRRHYYKHYLRHKIRTAKKRAEMLGIPFAITENDISIPDRCPVLGIPVRVGADVPRQNVPALDRMDNTKGYVKGNVRIISWRANSLKSDMSLDECRCLMMYMEAIDIIG